jgi:copper resistance protein C
MHTLKMVTAALASVAIMAGPALAHTSVEMANIEDAAVLETLPEVFSFSFGQPVGLISFSIRTETGETVDIGFQPPKAPAKSFSVPLPDLAPGRYTLEWRTLSKDGHPMNGKSAFELK